MNVSVPSIASSIARLMIRSSWVRLQWKGKNRFKTVIVMDVSDNVYTSSSIAYRKVSLIVGETVQFDARFRGTVQMEYIQLLPVSNSLTFNRRYQIL